MGSMVEQICSSMAQQHEVVELKEWDQCFTHKESQVIFFSVVVMRVAVLVQERLRCT